MALRRYIVEGTGPYEVWAKGRDATFIERHTDWTTACLAFEVYGDHYGYEVKMVLCGTAIL